MAGKLATLAVVAMFLSAGPSTSEAQMWNPAVIGKVCGGGEGDISFDLAKNLKTEGPVMAFMDPKGRKFQIKVGATGSYYVVDDVAGERRVHHYDGKGGCIYLAVAQSPNGKAWFVIKGPFETESEAKKALQQKESLN